MRAFSPASPDPSVAAAPVVLLREVTKTFGGRTVVDRFSLSVPRGSIYGLLGPNGSGKTTTIRMILGILEPDDGNVLLLGAHPSRHRSARVGYLPEERGVYRKMRVADFLLFLARIRDVPAEDARRRIDHWIDRVELSDRRDARLDDLSKGMQQKVQFIGAVLHEPEFLILDEPFSGLDPINQDLLEEIVKDLHRRGATILFSTHMMEQAERLCDRVTLIAGSRTVLEGPLEQIRAREARREVALRFIGDDGWLRGEGVSEVKRHRDGRWSLRLQEGVEAMRVLEAAMEAGVRITHFEEVLPRLHEIFVRHAGNGRGGER